MSLAALQKRIGYRFQDENLLRLALTHPSVAHERGKDVPHSQRLEFLGDAVLGLVLTHGLYERFPDSEEGPLTKSRAKLVNRTTLAEHGRALGLGEQLIMGRGEEASGGRDRDSALADAFEAVLGALYLDGGFDITWEIILREFSPSFSRIAALEGIENPKGELQELLQARSTEAPEYHIVSASGPDHDRVFECTVHHGGLELARGVGKSKKAAESEAAMAALKKLRGKED